MEPPSEVGKKVYINGTGRMTKMAAMLIYGKNLKKSNRPRYQVSVYRTIGPLIYFWLPGEPGWQKTGLIADTMDWFQNSMSD